MMDKNTKQGGVFNSSDVVIFDEIISRYSIFKCLGIPDDEIRVASEWEITVYNNRPES